MKNVLLIFAIVASLFAFNGKSQAQVQIGATAGVGLPFGDFGDLVTTGFGGSAHFKYFLADQFALGFNAGYYSFGGEEIDFGLGTLEGPSINIIPVTVAAEYYFTTEGFKPYGGLDLGLYILGTDVEETDSETQFGLAPTLGFSYELSETIDLNFNAKYNVIFGDDEEGESSSESFLGINIGILFTIGE